MTSAPIKKPAAAKAGANPARKTATNTGSRATAAKAPVEKPARDVGAKPEAGGTLRTPDLVARVAEVTDAKPKDIRATIQAILETIGKALDAGETLVLPPLGKLTVIPAKVAGGNGPMKLKLRRGAGPGVGKTPAKEALAEPGEAS